MTDPLETRITLRLPTVLRDRLIKAAEANARSMNGEIIFRLDDFDRLTEELSSLSDLLEEREEALFHARVKLRELEYQSDNRVDAHQQELEALRTKLSESQEINTLLSAHGQALEALRKDVRLLRDQLSKVRK